MGRGWQVAGACLVGLFGFALVSSLEYSLFDELGPGSGFFSFWLSVIGLLLCGMLLLDSLNGTAGSKTESVVLPDRSAIGRLILLAIAGVAASLLLEPLGFRLTMLLFIAGLLPALGARSPIAIGAMAVVGSFGVFHAFYYWLKVPLPIGMYGV